MASIEPIVSFIIEIDKLKGVTRKVKPLGLDRYENSAEHSWQLALMASSLQHLAASPVDINRVIAMLLVHDIGEIDTGDTMAFVEGGWQERKRDELAAVTRIFSTLPRERSDEYLSLWTEFEAGETAESQFANAMDRAMPVLLNLHNNGQSWRENGITRDRVVKRVEAQIRAGCPALWEYIEPRLQSEHEKGWFGA